MCFPVPFCILQGAGCRESPEQDSVHRFRKGEEQSGIVIVSTVVTNSDCHFVSLY